MPAYMTVICALCVVIVLQSVTHAAERKDLYSRIMAKDLTDYTSQKVGKNRKKRTPKYIEVMNKFDRGGGD